MLGIRIHFPPADERPRSAEDAGQPDGSAGVGQLRICAPVAEQMRDSSSGTWTPRKPP